VPLYIYGRGNFVGFEGDNKRARSNPWRASGLETTGTSVSEKHVSAIAPKVQWRFAREQEKQPKYQGCPFCDFTEFLRVGVCETPKR